MYSYPTLGNEKRAKNKVADQIQSPEPSEPLTVETGSGQSKWLINKV